MKRNLLYIMAVLCLIGCSHSDSIIEIAQKDAQIEKMYIMMPIVLVVGLFIGTYFGLKVSRDSKKEKGKESRSE
jgi:uncharacterized membrane protein